MAWLRFHVRLGMERRARPAPIRLHLLPALWPDCLLLAAISMLQQQLPWHLIHQLPLSQRRLACHLIQCRLRLPFPQRPNLGKHLLGPRAQILSSALPVSLRARFAILNRHSSSTPYHPHEILGCSPARSARSVLSRCTVAHFTASGVYLLCGTSPNRKLESATSSHRVASEPSKGMSNELRTNSPACHCAVG